MADIVDYAAQRSQTYAARDKQHIFAEKIAFDGEMFAVRSANGDLLTYFYRMYNIRDATALFDGKLHIFFVCR